MRGSGRSSGGGARGSAPSSGRPTRARRRGRGSGGGLRWFGLVLLIAIGVAVFAARTVKLPRGAEPTPAAPAATAPPAAGRPAEPAPATAVQATPLPVAVKPTAARAGTTPAPTRGAVATSIGGASRTPPASAGTASTPGRSPLAAATGQTPGALGGTPGALGGTPAALAGTPGALGGTSGAIGGTPGALGGTPGALGGTPGALGGTPGALGGTPGALGGTPGGSGGTLGGSGGTPVALGATPAVSAPLEAARGPSGEVALTFDAGADRGYAEDILDILQEQHVPASFGVTGVWARANPDLVRRMVADGHLVFNHTLDHRSFTGVSDRLGGLSAARRRAELDDADAIIAPLIGHTTRPWYRLPYGDDDAQVAAEVAPDGYTHKLGWTVDSLGWRGSQSTDIVARCLKLAAPGAIYVFHVGRASQDAIALPQIIAALRDKGFSFRRADQA